MQQRRKKYGIQGQSPPTIDPRPSLPSLGQGEESKWMRTQSEGEFQPIVRACLASTPTPEALPRAQSQSLNPQPFFPQRHERERDISERGDLLGVFCV